MRLFEIGEELRAWNELLDERDGDISDPEAAAAIERWFEELKGQEAAKLDAYCGLIRTWEAELAVATAERDQFARKAKSRENRIQWLKDRLRDYLLNSGDKKIETASGRTIRIQVNGTKPLVIDPAITAADLPLQFVKVKVEIDTKAIRDALNSDETPLPFARLGDPGYHLRIG